MFPKFLGVVYKIQCGLCNESYYGECVRHLAVRSGEHIGISPLTNKRVQPRKDSAVCHHLLNCNYSLEDFTVLCHENKKYILELKESLLIISDRPSMNWDVRSAPLSVLSAPLYLYVPPLSICTYRPSLSVCSAPLYLYVPPLSICLIEFL